MSSSAISPLDGQHAAPVVSVSRRLFLFGALPIALFVAFSIWMWLSLADVNRTIKVDLQQARELSLLAKDMQRNVVQVQQFLSDVSATRGQDGLDDGFALAEENGKAFLQGLDAFAKAEAAGQIALKPGELDGLRSRFDRYHAAGVTMAKAYVAGGPAEGNPLMEPFDAASLEMQNALNPFVERLTAELAASSDQVAVRVFQLQWLALAVCALAAAGVALVGWRVTRSIVRPLTQAAEAVHWIVQGDLTRALKIRGRDEIAHLTREVEAMRGRFLDVMRDLRKAADNLHTASTEIAAGNQDLSMRTEQTASNLEEAAASIEQLTSTIGQSAVAAREANQFASSASEIAVRGGQVVGQVVTTMDEINHSSKKINDIIGVIDGIAFQTNILALNAAVEAARAGEQGRGFAVVASEVRSLAQRSAEAAKEIKGLIGASVEKVEAGTRLVADAGQTMGEIVTSVQRATEIIAGISVAASEESQGITQVNAAVSQLDQMTQQNAALVEESAAAAESLKDQASRLAQIVQVFRIDGEAVSLPGSAKGPASPVVTRPAEVARVVASAATASIARLPVSTRLPAPPLSKPSPPAAPAKSAGSTAGEDEWESF